MRDLGTLPGGSGGGSFAADINDAGWVVGASDAGTTRMRAFLYDGAAMRDLGTLPGADGSQANGINAAGHVVGESGSRAFLFENGMMRDLGTLPGGDSGSASAINDRGQVAGRSTSDEVYEDEFFTVKVSRAVTWESGTIKNLGTLPEQPQSEAMGINNLGQIVGATHWVGGADFPLPFLHDTATGETRQLGDTDDSGGEAIAINDAGLVVGSADFGAFLYEDGTMLDLNGLIAADSGWMLEVATDINERGWIVGVGSNDEGFSRGFLLTPIDGPDPSPNPIPLPPAAWTGLCLGTAIVLPQVIRRRKRPGHE